MQVPDLSVCMKLQMAMPTSFFSTTSFPKLLLGPQKRKILRGTPLKWLDSDSTDFSCMDPFLPTTNLVILPGFVGMCMLASCSLYDLHEHHPAPDWCQVSCHNTMPLRAFSHQRYSLQVGCLLSLSWCQSHGLWVFLPMWFHNL